MENKFEMHFHGPVGEQIEHVDQMTVNIGSDGTVTKDKGDNTAAKWVGGSRENVGRCCRANQSKKECKHDWRPGQTKGAGRVNTDHKYLGIRFYFFDDPAWWDKTV